MAERDRHAGRVALVTGAGSPQGIGFAAATTMILGAAYTLWMYKRVIYGAVANDHVARLTDINRRELWLLAAVAAGVLAIGVYPKPLIDVMHTSVADLLTHVARSKL